MSSNDGVRSVLGDLLRHPDMLHKSDDDCSRDDTEEGMMVEGLYTVAYESRDDSRQGFDHESNDPLETGGAVQYGLLHTHNHQ